MTRKELHDMEREFLDSRPEDTPEELREMLSAVKDNPRYWYVTKMLKGALGE